MKAIDTTFLPPAAWVAAQLRRLPSAGLRRAVVLTGSERVAHAIRRHVCAERGEPELLAGATLTRPAAFARELLLAAGVARVEGWEDLRRLRLFSLFLSGALDRQLRYFRATQLQSSLGYAHSFAATIQDLESAGLDPALLARVAERLAPEDQRAAFRLHDVAVVWQRVDDRRGSRCSTAQALDEAARQIAAQPGIAVAPGPVLAVLTQSPSTVLLRFLAALPDCTVLLQEGRPWRTTAQRWRSGVALAEPDERDGAHRRELDLLQRYLFALPEVLTDPQRPRSHGADGSVSMEQYAGTEDEIEAAANWTAEQLAAGLPLERIALIVPELGPYLSPLEDRLQRLPLPESQLALYVAGGSALAGTPAGLRLLAVLNALAESLDARAVIRLLPMLRKPGQTSDTPSLRLTASRAAEIVYGAGILGGNPRDPNGLSEWVPKLGAMRDRLRAQLETAEHKLAAGVDDGLEQRRLQIEASGARQWLREVEPILPAVAAIQQLGEHVAADVSLANLWRELLELCEQHLLLPPHPPNLLAQLQARLAEVVLDPLGDEIRGRMAVQYLHGLLRNQTLERTRYGTAAIFIGTPAQAAGLSFDAVRMLGLAEGGVPRTPHDDPIVPDDLRQRVEESLALDSAAPAPEAIPEATPIVIPRLADRVLDDLHDVFRIAQGTERTLALSSPRQWNDRSERESSGVLLEVATSLGRYAAIDGEGDVPTAARLRAAYFEPDAQRSQSARLFARRTPRALLAAVAAELRTSPDLVRVPRSWEGGEGEGDGLAGDRRSALSIRRLRELAASAGRPELGPLDGSLGDAWSGFTPPGVSGRAISASALGVLLGCPHRFMLERVLHWQQPYRAPSSDAVDAAQYGGLLHAVAQELFAIAGEDICQRKLAVDELVAKARALADVAFDELCQTYPLRGSDSIERERERLGRQIELLVRDEWQRPKRQFVASELSFGQRQPIRVPPTDDGLRVWGAIDRVDRIDDGLSIRDIKTGRVHDFIEEPVNAARDLQIGLYALAVEQVAELGASKVVEAAYVHPSPAQEPERGFSGAQLEMLLSHTREWLRTAGVLLRRGDFVRTTSADDCRFCPFVPACGYEAAELSAVKLSRLPAAHELELFVRLKDKR